MNKIHLPPTWIAAALGEIAQVQTGNTPPTADAENYGGTLVFIQPPDLKHCLISAAERTLSDKGRTVARVVPPGSVFVSCIGNLGKTGLSTVECAFNQQINAATFPEEIDPKFAFYQAQLLRPFLENQASATTVAIVNKTKFSAAPFRIAPKNEQSRLVSKLDELFSDLDAGVAALERARANLKRYRAAVLKAAAEGKLTEQWRKAHPDVEPASKLLERILAERRKKWEEAQLAKFAAAGKAPPKGWKEKYSEPAKPDTKELPELPKGWCWATVEQLSTKVVDGVHKKPDYVPEGVPFVTVRNLTAGPGISFERLNYVSENDHREFIKRANPERGDILITKDGTLGVIRVVETDTVFSIFVSVAMIKPVLYDVSRYLGLALEAPQVQVQMVPKGSGLQHIHLEDLRQDAIPLAPLFEQAEIVRCVEERFSSIQYAEALLEANDRRCDRLRQSILKRAFEGKLVPQEPSDEPASVLLERIRVARGAEQPPTNLARKRKKA